MISQPPVLRQTVVDGTYVRHYRAALGLGLAAAIAQEKHEWLGNALADNTVERSPIYVYARLASQIVMAELQG